VTASRPAGRPRWQACGHGLLERAAGFSLEAIGGVGGIGGAGGVTPDLLSQPTPCRGWDLRMLLSHADESLTALHEGITAGTVALISQAALAPSPPPPDPVSAFRDRVTGLLRASRACLVPGGPRGDSVITVADRPMTLGTLRAVAALEIAVHGWDITQACGRRLPIPSPLAADLLELSQLLVPPGGRFPLFAPPVPVSGEASPSDRLAAYLGRHPGGLLTPRPAPSGARWRHTR
jgi:uncharacterized protein (TIGR03086 family)